MHVGIIEILVEEPMRGIVGTVYAKYVRKQLASIGPQAVSVWCRQLGHKVHYATYYDQQDPVSLLPGGLDVVFIATHTPASALAYALARIYRRERTLTVIGGPHAKAFPWDCLRFFDIVVQECDRALIDDILHRRFDPPAIVSSGRGPSDLPGVEERRPEIETASFENGRPMVSTYIPALTSLGCPYACDFCVEGENPYHALPKDRLLEDLRFISDTWPGEKIAYHDPNFGVRFNEVMDVMESIPEGRRNPYIMESSLANLKAPRLARLRDTNCFYIAPGIESWSDYANKAGVGNKQGWVKLEQVVDHFNLLSEYVRGLQGNIMVGTDAEKGAEPFEITREFIRRLPQVWTSINLTTPFGGTPLTSRFHAEGRVLKQMPFSLYFNNMTTTLKNYSPLEFYDQLIGTQQAITAKRMIPKRILANSWPYVRIVHNLRTLLTRQKLTNLRRVRHLLARDRKFRAFHEGAPEKLPEYYLHKVKQRLGPYSGLLSRADLTPLLDGEGPAKCIQMTLPAGQPPGSGQGASAARQL